MIYDIDQCEVRDKELLIKQTVIEILRTKIALLKRMLDDAVGYGFRRNQENTKLHRYIGELEREIAAGAEDEKDRLHDNR